MSDHASPRETILHPTAIIAAGARIGPGCHVGPHAVIDADVELGANCDVGPGVYLTGRTRIGPNNRFHAGAVIGDAPQDLKYDGTPTRLVIGAGNTFREHVTLHRAAKATSETRVGDGNLFMAGSHLGHDCRIGNHNILANGALVAGEARLDDRAFLSGNCLVHQGCRVGRLALMQGGSAISKDLPPFCIATGDNTICGLNIVGLRRAGFDAAARLLLKRVYLRLFRFRGRRSEALARIREEFAGFGPAMEWVEFVASTRRGVCADRSSGPTRGTADADGE